MATEYNNNDLTVNSLSIQGTPFSSDNWNSGFTTVNSASANWNTSFSVSNILSADSVGTTWTSVPSAFYTTNWKSIAYGNGVFVAGHTGSTTNPLVTANNNKLAISYDGYNWSSVTSPLSSPNFIMYGNGTFVMFRRQSSVFGSAQSYYSTDGVNWVQSNINSTNSALSSFGVYYGFCYSNNQFNIFRETDVVVSTNGIVWSVIPYQNGVSMSATISYSDQVCYANGKFISAILWEAGGITLISTDGITWQTYNNVPSNIIPGIAPATSKMVYGNGTFVVFGVVNDSPVTYVPFYSKDNGLTWTMVSGVSSTTTNILLTFGNGVFVFKDPNTSYILTSKDGITWRRVDHQSSSLSTSNGCYGNGTFVVLTQGGGAMVSGGTLDPIPRNNLANWNSVFNTVQSNSATNWNNDVARQYVHSNFIPLSGGTITGNLSVLGNITYLDTAVQVTSAMYIDTASTETALRITQRGSGDVIRVEDDTTSPDTTPFIVKFDGSVGIGTTTPNQKLTVVGNVSATGTIFASGGNSDNWNSSFTTVQSNSANWNPVIYTTYNALTSLKATNSLVVGQQYIIQDFRLMWWNQSVNNTVVLSAATIEPLLVTALSSNKISDIAYSTLYENEYVYYDIDATTSYTWGNSPSAIPNFKGWIYRRVNTLYNIDLCWDYRFIRVNCCRPDFSSFATYNAASSYNFGEIVRSTNNLYISVSANNIGNDVNTSDTWVRPIGLLQSISGSDSQIYFPTDESVTSGACSFYTPTSGLVVVPALTSTRTQRPTFVHYHTSLLNDNNSNLLDAGFARNFNVSYLDGHSNIFKINGGIGSNSINASYFTYNIFGGSFYQNTIKGDMTNCIIGENLIVNDLCNIYNCAFSDGVYFSKFINLNQVSIIRQDYLSYNLPYVNLDWNAAGNDIYNVFVSYPYRGLKVYIPLIGVNLLKENFKNYTTFKSEETYQTGNLTLSGQISSTGIIFASGGNSDQWNSTFTTIQSNSASNWNNSKTIAFFTAMDNEPPATNFATLDTRNSHPVLDFDAATQEAAVFRMVIPEGLNLANGLTIFVQWAATSATTGTIGWDVAFERIVADSLDIDEDGFETPRTITAATVSSTSGVTKKTSVTFTQVQLPTSLAGGDMVRIKIRRDVANDDAAGDAELLGVEIRST